MLNWYFYNTFATDVNEDFETSKNTKIYISQNPKNTKYRLIQGTYKTNGTGGPEINTAICWFTQSHSTEYWLNVVTTIFNQCSTTIMLNWCFYNAFSEDVNEDFWYFKNTKFYISQNPKKHKIPNTIKTTERGKQK